MQYVFVNKLLSLLRWFTR